MAEDRKLTDRESVTVMREALEKIVELKLAGDSIAREAHARIGRSV